VKVGERVVLVVVEGKERSLNVKEVLLGAGSSADHKQ
jgi:hypothetical protein